MPTLVRRLPLPQLAPLPAAGKVRLAVQHQHEGLLVGQQVLAEVRAEHGMRAAIAAIRFLAWARARHPT